MLIVSNKHMYSGIAHILQGSLVFYELEYCASIDDAIVLSYQNQL